MHTPAYSHEEVLLGQDVIDELELKPGTFLEIRAATAQQPQPTSHHQVSTAIPSLDVRGRTLVLRAPSKASKGALRVSLIRSVADVFALQARQTVLLRRVTADDAGLDWVELSFKDQQLTRGDIWHFRRRLIERSLTVHIGKTVSLAGIRAQVYRMEKGTRPEAAGVLTQNTMLRFRSRSAAFVLLIQVSAEMGEFDTGGELFHEKAIGFLRSLFRRWKALGVSHSLSIVLFCRCYVDDPAKARPMDDLHSCSTTDQDSSRATGRGSIAGGGHMESGGTSAGINDVVGRAGSSNAAASGVFGTSEHDGASGGIHSGGGRGCSGRVDGGTTAGGREELGADGGSGSGEHASKLHEAPLQTDRMGRQYSDYYQLVAENESRADWEPLLPTLKRHFLSFGPSLKRREPTTSLLPGGIESSDGGLAGGSAGSGSSAGTSSWSGHSNGAWGIGGGRRMHDGGGVSRRNSTAAYGNLLEAINLALDIHENSYEECDLASTGKSIVCLSAGSGWFEVDRHLEKVTKQRLTDNGIGCDVVCCGSPPLHIVPLFTYVSPDASDLPAEAPAFRVPHWMLVSFTDPQPPSPLPPCRVTAAPPIANQARTAPMDSSDSHGSSAPPRDGRPRSASLVLPYNLPPLGEQPREPGSAAETSRNAAKPARAALFASVDTTGSRRAQESAARHHLFDVEPTDSSQAAEIAGLAEQPSQSHARSSSATEATHAAAAESTSFSFGAYPFEDDDSGAGLPMATHHARLAGVPAVWPRPASSQPIPTRRTTVASLDEDQTGTSWRRTPVGSFASEDRYEDWHDVDSPFGSQLGSSMLGNGTLLGSSPGQCSLMDACGATPFATMDSDEPGELGGLPPPSANMHAVEGIVRARSSSGSSTIGFSEPPPAAARGQRRHTSETHEVSPRPGSVNPFMFDAEKLKHLSHESQARRLWREGNHIFSSSSVIQDLEHQWTSLSEPAVLPLTSPVPKRFKEMLKTAAQFGTWSLAVPMQEEVASGIPYERAMTADELLQELLCQRFEQDFQLLKYVKMSKQLSLQQEQTYYLSQGNQVHKIVFMHEGQVAPPRTPALINSSKAATVEDRLGRSGAGASTGASAGGGGSSKGQASHRWRAEPEPSLSFSKVQVTRFLMQQGSQTQGRPSPQRQNDHYHYYVCGPHGKGFQRAATKIRATEPHVFPWNRLDSIVCGWDNYIDLDIRLRCKRFALLDFQEMREDSLRRLLTAPAGTQRLMASSVAGRDAAMPAGMEAGVKPSSASMPPGAMASAVSSASPACEAPWRVARTTSVAPGVGSVDSSPRSGIDSHTQPSVKPVDADTAGAAAKGGNTAAQTTGAPSLSKDRFAKFVAAVRSRLPIGDRVQWIDSPSAAAGHESVRGVHSQLLDMTNSFSDRDREEQRTVSEGEEGDIGPRRMFLQLQFDPTASPEQAWHLEIRWNMCQGHKVEDLVKYCMRRARQVGLLMLQVPTGRRPRPFSPPVLVPISTRLQPRALMELRTRLCFLRESLDASNDLHAGRSSAAPGERWMHELGVAFVQRDKHGRGFLWTVNRILPSQAGRSHSEKLLAQFREICERLEMDDAEQKQQALVQAAQPARSATERPASTGGAPASGSAVGTADYELWDWSRGRASDVA